MRRGLTPLPLVVLAVGCGGSHPSVRTIVQERVQTETQTQTDTVTVANAPAPSGQPAPSAGAVQAGGDWIAQLGSFRYHDGAERFAAAFRAHGVQANVLYSDAYLEMHRGYWVVYVGFFGSAARAGAVARQAHSFGSPDAFARRVTYDVTR